MILVSVKLAFFLKEPFVYRLIEAVRHYGHGLKLIANEKKGDGIISAIDLYVSLDEVKGVHDEDRLVLTFNGNHVGICFLLQIITLKFLSNCVI